MIIAAGLAAWVLVGFALAVAFGTMIDRAGK